ncbi:MAG: LytTR family DNA-binding domain-containing protein [Peptoniphilus sp.]|nr:LytTR family DNA-binding domain-containing protein [Peptoniphilus sp.]MDY3118333.1 LytTR family DNA-binding domain-containing protein [Peptoniphilus sp.]
MKVEIIIDEAYDRPAVKIYTRAITEEVEKIREALSAVGIEKMVGMKGDQVFLLDYEKIVRIYAEDKSVYALSGEEVYRLRLSLAACEERLRSHRFLRIARSDVINLDYVKKLDLSFTGTIAVEMKNGDVLYVSRRNLRAFKEALGW